MFGLGQMGPTRPSGESSSRVLLCVPGPGESKKAGGDAERPLGVEQELDVARAAIRRTAQRHTVLPADQQATAMSARRSAGSTPEWRMLSWPASTAIRQRSIPPVSESSIPTQIDHTMRKLVVELPFGRGRT